MVTKRNSSQAAKGVLALLALTISAASPQQIALAAQNEAAPAQDTTTAQNTPTTASQSTAPAFEKDLDKIDDVNPYVIKGVMVDGNKLIPRGQIKAVIKTKPGDFYHRKEIEQDLRAIYKMGYFTPEDMRVEALTTSAGMVIKIHLKENPFFKSITFSGNKIVPTEKMEELFKAQLLKPQSRTQIASSLKTIKSWYKAQGYLLATTNLQKDDASGKLAVTVDEGLIKEIKIVCPTEEQKKLLQDSLTIKNGDVYNENKLSQDLKTAFKSGKFDNLEREVDRDKGGGYVISITSITKEKPHKAGATPILKQSSNKSGLPVLNKLIHSPMYKSIKQ